MGKKISISFISAVAAAVVLIAIGFVVHFALQMHTTEMQSTLPQNPFPYKGPTPVFGLLYSATNNSVTVADQKGAQQVFTVNSETQMVSQVPAGQAGKALSQFTLNSTIIVLPQPGHPDVAATVSETPAPFIPPQGAAVSSVVGAYISGTASMVTLQGAGSSTITVHVSTTTMVVANALAGKVTPKLSAIGMGTELNITGIKQTDGSVDALQIQILVPLGTMQGSQ